MNSILINWPDLFICVFIAQLVEHCSGNAEATGSNEAPMENLFVLFFYFWSTSQLRSSKLRWSHFHFRHCLAVRMALLILKSSLNPLSGLKKIFRVRTKLQWGTNRVLNEEYASHRRRQPLFRDGLQD